MKKDPRKLLIRINKLVSWSSNINKRRKQKKSFLRQIRIWMRRARVKKKSKSAVPVLSKSVVQPKFRIMTPGKPKTRKHASPKTSKVGRSMTRTGKNVLLSMKQIDVFRFPIIDWDYRWQRPQQIAVQFAKDGHRVFYYSIDTLPVPQKDATYKDISEKVVIEKLQKNVWFVRICSHQSLNAYRTEINDPLDIQYLNWSIQSLKEKFQIDHTLSIVDLPFWAPLALGLSNNKVIYDCMDEHTGFSNVSRALLDIEPELIKHADIVVASSERLYNKVKQLNPSTLLVRNAVEYEHFSQQPLQVAPELENIIGPVIGYIGTIADWFDMKLIVYLAETNKDWTFVLVGHHYINNTEPTEYPPNIIFVGEKPYSELPQFLCGFDVCLIPFLVNELTLATNPVKVYEYLASGKPVVSTKLPELELIDEFVRLAGTPEEFEQAIKLSLQDNSEEVVKQRREFAYVNTWGRRYKDLKSFIKKNLFPKVSVVIVTHNNWDYTKQCLESLFRNSRYPNLEIIVVDNASTDKTRIGLSGLTHPDLKLIFTPLNIGFAGGNSLGCKIASGDYVILLNNDTIVPPGWVQRLIDPLIKHAELGMVGPMSNMAGNDQMLDYPVGRSLKGVGPDWLSEFYDMNKGRIRFTEMLGFYCVAIRREVYEKTGHLDSEFAIGMFEDDDYCERVRNLGYKLAIVEDAFVYHHGSVSFKKLSREQYSSIFNENKLYFERKWGKEWVPHAKPNSLFLEVTEADSVARIIKENKTKSILVLGKKDWSASGEPWQQLTRSLCGEETLVIASVHSYYGQKITGIRKVGPSLYFTNRIDLLEKAEFDLIVYSGESEFHTRLHAGEVQVDVSSYDERKLTELVEKLDSIYDKVSELPPRSEHKLTNQPDPSHSLVGSLSPPER